MAKVEDQISAAKVCEIIKKDSITDESRPERDTSEALTRRET